MSEKSSLSSFPFMDLPQEIQVHVMNQLPAETIMFFRHSCRHFFQLTSMYKQQRTKCRRIVYETKAHEFQRIIYGRPHKYQDSPTSKFWNHYGYRIKLHVIKVHEDDKDNFMEKLKQFPLVFDHLQIRDIPLSLMHDLFFHLSYIESHHMNFSKLHMDELLCSSTMQLLKGEVILADSIAFEEYYQGIQPSLVSVKSINHIIRQWIEEDYQFATLLLTPISVDAQLDELLVDVNYIKIFDRKIEAPSILRDLNLYNRRTRHSCVRWCVAIKRRNFEECCLIFNNGDRMVFKKCQEQKLINEAFTFLFELSLETIYPMQWVENVCKQKLF